MAQDSVRYICPVCDQEIAAGSHFCWNCKRIVRSPWRYTGGHLPNENHDGCHPMKSFLKPRVSTSDQGSSPKSRAYMPKRSSTQKFSAPGTAAGKYTFSQGSAPKPASWQNTAPGNTYRNPSAQKSGGAGQKKNSGAGALAVVFVVFWFIIWLFSFARW